MHLFWFFLAAIIAMVIKSDFPSCVDEENNCANNGDEFCQHEAYSVLNKSGYILERNTTKSGLECQMWSDQLPHNHSMLSLPHNYCRNLDQSTGPWCYTTNESVRSELCWENCNQTMGRNPPKYDIVPLVHDMQAIMTIRLSEAEFATLLSNNWRMIQWLARYGLIANERICPGHQERMTLIDKPEKTDGKMWRCPQHKTIKLSVRHGSFFEDSHLELKQIVHFVWRYTNHPTDRISTLMEHVDIGKNSAVDWANHIRDVYQDWCEENANLRKLGGPNTIVELDESLIFKKKYHIGHVERPQRWVFGMVERGTNKVMMQEVPDRSHNTLNPIIIEWILPGTRIVTDGWGAYTGHNGIASLQYNLNGALRRRYDHDWVNHQVNFVDPNDPTIHTQSIEATWSRLKADLRQLHGTSEAKLETYLFQYQFRRNHNNELIFNHVLFWIRHMYPVPA